MRIVSFNINGLRARPHQLEALKEKYDPDIVAHQEIKSEVLLPLVYNEKEINVKDRLYEPSKEKLVSSLVPRHLNIQIWKYLLESYASEQAARMMAMENATTNAKDMIKSLTLEFNKARQAAITTEMLEIVSGAEALKE